jgi:hypothetical protein
MQATALASISATIRVDGDMRNMRLQSMDLPKVDFAHGLKKCEWVGV